MVALAFGLRWLQRLQHRFPSANQLLLARQLSGLLARVLAWRENSKQPSIAEIKYELNLAPNGQSQWRLQWLDANGKVIPDGEASCREELLTEGPKFYRSVFRISAGVEAWLAAIGANLAGFSRMETIRVAIETLR